MKEYITDLKEKYLIHTSLCDTYQSHGYLLRTDCQNKTVNYSRIR